MADHASGARFQRMAHRFRQIAHLGGKFHRQAGVVAFAAAVVADSLGVIAEQLVAGIAASVGKQRLHFCIIMREIALQHRFAEGFLRAKIVVERAFRHARGGQQFAQPHAGKAQAQAEGFAGGEQMFTCIHVAMR